MKSNSIYQSLLLHFVVAFAVLLAAISPVRADAVFDELVAKGDVSDHSFKPAEALKSYLPAATVEPNNVPLLLRISRQYRHLMTDEKNSAKKLEYGRTALSYDMRAATLAPNDSEAQLTKAITYGKMLPLLSKKEQVAASPVIKAAADRAIKLDPHNDLAWHVLGRWNQQIADVTGLKRTLGELLYGKLPTGSYAESVKCFNMAISINPNRLRHYIELGITYAMAAQPLTAKKFIQVGLAMPNKEKDDAELKGKGKMMLAQLR